MACWLCPMRDFPLTSWCAPNFVPKPKTLPCPQNGLAAFGAACFLFTALCFCLLLLYHYRKTAGQMSTVFAPKNVPVFLGVAMVRQKATKQIVFFQIRFSAWSKLFFFITPKLTRM